MSDIPILRLSGIAKNFGAGPVLADVNLILRPGERRGLIGPNGAGKTTLINVVTGALAPDAGDIFFRGRSITKLSPYQRNRRGIARSFQILSLFGDMTVGDNIRNAILRYRGLHVVAWRRLARLDEVTAEVAQLAATVGLASALAERVDTLPLWDAAPAGHRPGARTTARPHHPR